jgi:hypothetical protein
LASVPNRATDLEEFVAWRGLGSRYFEKPYYLESAPASACATSGGHLSGSRPAVRENPNPGLFQDSAARSHEIRPKLAIRCWHAKKNFNARPWWFLIWIRGRPRACCGAAGKTKTFARGVARLLEKYYPTS